MKKNLTLLAYLLVFATTCFAQNNNTFLWRINTSGNPSPSYLFGTIHLPQEQFMLVSDSAYAAISNSGVFYTELDFDDLYGDFDMSDNFFQSKLDYLDSVKKTPSWKRMINAVNRRYNTNIDPDSLDQFSAFGNRLLAEYMKADPGVTALDIALEHYAKALGKTCRGLETFKFQINMLYKVIDARLSDSTLLFDDEVTLTKDLQRFYVSQQFDSLSTILETINPNYRKIIFDERNRTMADSIEKIAGTKAGFFAVGCGHLLGEQGIIRLLQKKGITLTPVFSKNRISVTLMEQFIKNSVSNVKKTKNNDNSGDSDNVIESPKEDNAVFSPPPPPPAQSKKKTVVKPKTKKQ